MRGIGEPEPPNGFCAGDTLSRRRAPTYILAVAFWLTFVAIAWETGPAEASFHSQSAPPAHFAGIEKLAAESLNIFGEIQPFPQPMTTVAQTMAEKELRFGMVAPFTGSAKELGSQMKVGVEAAFDAANDAGGVNSRVVRLVTADDGYDPARTLEAVKQLRDKDQIIGLVGDVGTPTAAAVLPFVLENHMLFYGAFTGAGLLRSDPPDRYVVNYRASYVEETDAVVRYLVKIRRLRLDQIAVFAQQDAFGDAGYAGVEKAFRALSAEAVDPPLRLGYARNTVDVAAAMEGLRKKRQSIKAVVMVATYRAAAKFIEKTRDLYPDMIYTDVSFVGSTALSAELTLLGPRYANGVIVTQVVPAVDGYSSLALEYRAALAKYFPSEKPDYVSFEGYVEAKILTEALTRAGPQLDVEKLVDAFETIHNLDIGLGASLNYGRAEHQGSHKVWGTQLDSAGKYQPIDLR